MVEHMWLGTALVLAFHIGGLPARARYENPIDLGQVADQTYAVIWTDGDQDPTGMFNFGFQPLDGPPNAGPELRWYVTPQITNAQQVAVLDTANTFVWDTSQVPAGTYIIYEITEDPGIDSVVSVSPGPVTIQHTGDPLWPAVITDEPDGLSDIVNTNYAARFRATGVGALTANIYYGVPLPNGLPDPDAQPVLIQSGFPLEETSPGFYKGCYLWDVSTMPEGFYWMLIEVVDEGARTHANYSKGMVIVSHAPGAPDAGASGTCAELTVPDAAPYNVDAGRDGPIRIPPDEPPCLCRVGAPRPQGARGWLGIGVAVALLVELRRRRSR